MVKEDFPKVRFKGFDGKWNLNKIGEITSSYSGGTPKSGNKEYYEGEIPFIRSGEIKLDKTELFINEVALSNSSAKMVEVGDVLYALYGATSGEVSISKIKGAINQAILALKPVDDFNTQFIVNFLKKEKGNILDKYLQGGQGNLSAAIIKNIDINTPENVEQSRIGSLFSTIDSLLSSYKDNLENYQSFKKSMLAKMFPKAGQSVPEIRLDRFEGRWEEEIMKDIVDRVKSYSLSRDVEHDSKTDIKYIHYGDIHTQKAGIIKATNGLPYITNSEKYAETLQRGDLIFADASEDYKGIAMVAVIKDDLPYKVVAGLHTIASRPRDKFDSIFLYYYFKTQVFRKHGYKVGTGMKVFGISPDNLFKFELSRPSLPEQHVIGTFFSNLDDLISSYQSKIKSLETLKKKLLQDMFI